MTDKPMPRLVTPGKWVLIAATGLAAAQPALAPDFLFAKAHAASEAGESGEAGEAGVELGDGPEAYLTELGLFEEAHRIVAALYAQGETDLAREHLEASHHAYYEDIAPRLAEHGAPGFEAQTEAFARAVTQAGDPSAVAQAAAAIFQAIEVARSAAAPSVRTRVLSIHELLAIAAANFGGGVEAGIVTEALEYRDAWGFVETARALAEALAGSADTGQAEAGREILKQLDAVAPLFPALTATQAPGDPGLLAAAAAWIEIIALRQE